MVLLFIVAALTAWYGYFRLVPESKSIALPLTANTASVSEQSLYQLESLWTTDTDETVKLRELQGRYTILSLMFTRCTGTCPLLTKQLQAFSASLPPDIKNQTRFVAITIDPGDTGESLLRYRDELKLDKQQWMLLRGAPTAVRELAAVLGFNYIQTNDQANDPTGDPTGNDTQFSHSNLLTVLNPKGEIIHQQQGAGSDLSAVAAAIRRAM